MSKGGKLEVHFVDSSCSAETLVYSSKTRMAASLTLLSLSRIASFKAGKMIGQYSLQIEKKIEIDIT